MSAVTLVVQIGALAIPGVGEAIDGGMSTSDQAKAEHYSQNHTDINL